MGKIDFVSVYEDRLKQIDEDIKKATRKKNWTELAKLRAEEDKLKDYINKLKVGVR